MLATFASLLRRRIGPDVAIEIPARKLHRESSAESIAVHLGAAGRGDCFNPVVVRHLTMARRSFAKPPVRLLLGALLSLGARDDCSRDGLLLQGVELHLAAREPRRKSSILRMPPLQKTTSAAVLDPPREEFGVREQRHVFVKCGRTLPSLEGWRAVALRITFPCKDEPSAGA